MNELRKRPGRFEIDESFIEKDDTAIQIMNLVMSKMFIVRCEHEYTKGTFYYHAYSWLFDVIEEGIEAPLYMFEFGKKPDGETMLIGVERVKR